MKKGSMLISIVLIVSSTMVAFGQEKKESDSNWRYEFSKDSSKVIKWLIYGKINRIDSLGSEKDCVEETHKSIKKKDGEWSIVSSLRGKLTEQIVYDMLWENKPIEVCRKKVLSGEGDIYEVMYAVVRGKQIVAEIVREGK